MKKSTSRKSAPDSRLSKRGAGVTSYGSPGAQEAAESTWLASFRRSQLPPIPRNLPPPKPIPLVSSPSPRRRRPRLPPRAKSHPPPDTTMVLLVQDSKALEEWKQKLLHSPTKKTLHQIPADKTKKSKASKQKSKEEPAKAENDAAVGKAMFATKPSSQEVPTTLLALEKETTADKLPATATNYQQELQAAQNELWMKSLREDVHNDSDRYFYAETELEQISIISPTTTTTNSSKNEEKPKKKKKTKKKEKGNLEARPRKIGPAEMMKQVRRERRERRLELERQRERKLERLEREGRQVRARSLSPTSAKEPELLTELRARRRRNRRRYLSAPEDEAGRQSQGSFSPRLERSGWERQAVELVDPWFTGLPDGLKDGTTALLVGDPEEASRRLARRIGLWERERLRHRRRDLRAAAESWAETMRPEMFMSPEELAVAALVDKRLAKRLRKNLEAETRRHMIAQANAWLNTPRPEKAPVPVNAVVVLQPPHTEPTA